MRNNEITYKRVKITKDQHGYGGGRYFSYTVSLRWIASDGTRFSSIRETSLDRIKDSINDELSRGAVTIDGNLFHNK